ncbi:MAG: hypothetical protein WC934_15255, partial [Acidithiobacillus sp.]|uniref:hypothetical protein n=1 Tax=Acidithiobacillus sp. TaxID=1872118 RepID=UPI003560384F
MYKKLSKLIFSENKPQWLDDEIIWNGNYENTLRILWGNRKFDGWRKGNRVTKNPEKYQKQLEHILMHESESRTKFRESKLSIISQIEKLRNKIILLKLNPGDDVDEWNKKIQYLGSELLSLI